jgi:hypothetical protein
MDQWLRDLGARKRPWSNVLGGHKYILDGIDSEFYLIFDASIDTDNKASDGSVDILIGRPGHIEDPPIRIMADAKEPQVKRFLFALGVHRFSDQTKSVLYQMSNPLRENAQKRDEPCE